MTFVTLCIKQYESIMVVNDVVLKYDNRPLANILDVVFINIINFKNKINNNAYIIEIKNLQDYLLLINLDNKFDMNYFTPDGDEFIIVNDNNSMSIDEIQKSVFFNDIKTFSMKTYIRYIKLQKLL